MKMTSCNQCGDIISKSVEVCENCGTSNIACKSKPFVAWVALLLPVMALLILFKIIVT